MSFNIDNLRTQDMVDGTEVHAAPIEWSPMQEDIFHGIEHTDNNIIIEAVAGSGKTQTILKGMHKTNGSVLFLAFNRAIAQELADKTPMGVDSKTFNGLGHKLLYTLTQGKLEKWKINNLVKSALSSAENKEWGREIVKIISTMKGNGVVNPTDNEILNYVEHTEIPIKRIGYAAMVTSSVWELSMDISKTFTFDDQLYMPVIQGVTFPSYDTVFVDEAQDLNAIQHMMLQKLADNGARVIMVGDSRQAIYGFRGALTASMSALNSRFNCDSYPLSISYRCSKRVVAEAQTIVPHITAAEDADEGTVTTILDRLPPGDIPTDSMILCRTNAPMFSYAIQFLKEKVPCLVMSNFGEGLITFVKNFKSTTTEDLRKELEAWRLKSVTEAQEEGLYHKINRIQDKAECIEPFCDEFEIKSQVVAGLERLLRSTTGPTLCTIHKSKGLEAENIYLLRPDLVPAPWIDPHSEEYQQEENLLYVAITRAKQHFTYMEIKQ